MSLIIENDYLLVEFRTQGAEVIRFYSKRLNEEIIWQKDPNIWNYQAPLLFPKVGSLYNSEYAFEHQQYAMPNHGFLRNSECKVVQHTKERICFSLETNEFTLQYYPFQFKVYITYEIQNETLNLAIKVENHDTKVLPFELGYHPAFNIKSYLSTKIVFPTQLIERYAFFNKENLEIKRKTRNVLHTSKRLFDHRHTMIYRGLNTPYSLVTPNYKLQFESSDFPYLTIWSKDESFVCVEPWTTLPDLFPNNENWSNRTTGMNFIDVKQSKTFSMSMTVMD